jgi:hypothetical protein
VTLATEGDFGITVVSVSGVPVVVVAYMVVGSTRAVPLVTSAVESGVGMGGQYAVPWENQQSRMEEYHMQQA